MKKWIGLLVVLLVVGSLSGCKTKNQNEASTVDSSGGVDVSGFSVYDFYNENSEKIISVEEAATYEGTITAEQAISDSGARGFNQSALTYDFDVSGNYLGETEAESGSDEKAPMYLTTYVTEDNSLWYIYMIGDRVLAYPISYVMNQKLDYEIVLSESEELMCYDDTENKYYVTIPKESVVKLVLVDRINADTLEKYTAEELSRL